MNLIMDAGLSKTAIVALCALIVSGCGSSNKNKLQLAESLDGSWENGCQNNGINSPFTRYRYEVAQDTFDLSVTRYADPQCTSATFQVVYGGTITDRESQALSRDPGAVAASIDVRFEAVSITTLSQAQVSIHQASALCGITDWQIDVNYDVVGCAAIPLSNVPYNEYNVYSISETSNDDAATHAIYFGTISGTTPDDRPAEVDLGNPFYGNLP